MNSSLSYQIPKWKTVVALYYKHIGKQQQFVEKTNVDGNQEFQKGSTAAYNWLDATIKKSFFSKKIETTIGLRNLFDVSSVKTSATPGGTHTDAPKLIPLAYGRSFFLKLAYNLNL